MSDVCRCGYKKEQHGTGINHACRYFRFDHSEPSDLDALKAAVRELRDDVVGNIEPGTVSGERLAWVRDRLDAIMKGVGG